jgi:type II secretion system protein G
VKKMLEFFSRRKGQKGFTLIELLVVIAIIGILATIVLVSLNTARSKARDTRRISDLRQVALALEMYYDDHSDTGYPADGTPGSGCDAWATMEAALEPTYITSVPADPGTYSYAYESDADAQGYVLRAQLENDNNALDDDVDGTPNGCACDDTAAPYYYCIQP